MPAQHPLDPTLVKRSVRVALFSGLVLTAVAIAVVLSSSPPTVVATNSVPAHRGAAIARGGSSGCQVEATVPQGTSAIRISISANTGPRVTLTVLSGSRVVTQGERDAGWGIYEALTIPVNPVPHQISNASVCIAFGPAIEPIEILGAAVPTITATGRTRSVVRFRVEYLRPGHATWWSLAPSVAGRMGRGHAPSGTWIVFVLIAIMITLATLAARLVLRDLGMSARPAARAGKVLRRVPGALRRIPRAAWVCALIACLNAVCWSLITPPFQVPDEPAHFAYVQHLAETRSLPSERRLFSEEEEVALNDLGWSSVRWHPENHPVATHAQQRMLEHDLASPSLQRAGPGGAAAAAKYPPLYYALQTIPYAVGSGGSLLDRLELMRLLSALMGGLTALFVFLFVREALPGASWAWAVGGLGVALAPLLAFMSGTVNPDAMLFTVSAATFYLLARAFRRGLTERLAIAIGVVTAIGLLTKHNFIGLAPGIILGLVVLTIRAAHTSGRAAYRSLALAGVIAVSPACLYVVINLFSNHPGLGLVSTRITETSRRGSVLSEISYIWQSYLPRLPGMANDFPGISTTRQMWFDRGVGFYGWGDTSFPVWVENLALIPAGLLTILGVRALIRVRATLRARLVELAVYAVMAVGLLVIIGASAWLVPEMAGSFSEPRYLLPLLSLLGAGLVLSARGAGRRWGPAVGALIVVLFLAYDIFSQLQVIARFYG